MVHHNDMGGCSTAPASEVETIGVAGTLYLKAVVCLVLYLFPQLRGGIKGVIRKLTLTGVLKRGKECLQFFVFGVMK